MISLFLLFRSTESGPAESNGTNSDHVEEPTENVNSSNQSCQKTRHMFTQTERSGYATLIDMLSDEERLKNFTGVHSFELLDAIVLCLTDLAEDKARGRKKDMSLKDRVILTFVKLKQNLSFTSLGILFGISRQSCSHYFRNMVPKLAIVLETMIPWPDHETIRMNLPVAFKNYKNTRIVLDCAETPIEKSKCLLCRILTYSNYKGKHTAKFDVGVAPSGLITHISQAYGGRASDKLIVNKSGILNKLDYQDAVMVDKGYKIEQECLVVSVSWFHLKFPSQNSTLKKIFFYFVIITFLLSF